MQRKELRGGAALTVLAADHFKTCRITINFILPSQRQTATDLSLLPMVLERGYADCPDMTELSRRLAALYGASLSTDSTTQGENRIVSISIGGLKDRFALHGEALSAGYADILFGTAFDPSLPGGLFDGEAVEIEKQKLREILEGEINNKRSYCIQQAQRLFLGDSPAGIERNGYLADLPGVTPATLTAAYRQMVRTARIEVLVLGADAQEVERRLLQKLDALDRAPAAICPAVAMPAAAPVVRTETVDTVQSKLCLVFTAGRVLTRQEMDHMRLAAALLGGLPSSRLFRNVREKQSLCYYCSCGFSYLISALTVDSGIDPQNNERARQAILAELAALVQGPISEREMEETRVAYISSLRAVGDSLAAMELWAVREILRGSFAEPEEVERSIAAATTDDLRRVLGLLSLSVSYLLTKGETTDGD